MSGLFDIRRLSKLTLFWLPLVLAAGLAYMVVQDSRLGYQALNAAKSAPELVEVNLKSNSATWVTGRLSLSGQSILIRMDESLIQDNPAQPITVAGHLTEIQPSGDAFPAYLSNSLVQKYQASVGFYGVPLSDSSVTYSFLVVWFLLLAVCFHITISTRRHEVSQWTQSTPEIREICQLIRPEGSGLHSRNPGSLAVKGLACLLALPTVVLLLLLSAAYLVFVGFLALPEQTTSDGLLIGAAVLLLLAGTTAVIATLRKALPSPTGLPVATDHLPELKKQIDQLCQELALPKISDIFITEHFELDFSLYLPRHGLPLPRISLVIGLPLLQSLTPEEFKARLSGELARHSGRFGRMGAYLTRASSIWKRHKKQRAGRKRSLGHQLLELAAPLRPYLNALCLTLVRTRKQQAACFAIQRTTPSVTTSSIIRSHYSQHLFERRFWDEFYQGAAHQTLPATLPFDLTQSYFSSDHVRQMHQEFYGEDFPKENTPQHSSRLNRCLTGLGLIPIKPGRLNRTAAQEMLGSEESAVRDAMNSRWWEKNAEIWHACHGHFNKLANRQKQLDQLYEEGRLTEESWLEWADITHSLDGVDAAADCYESLLTIYPQNIRANYQAGWYRLQQGDSSGLQMLEIVAEGDPDLAEDVCRDALAWLDSQNRNDLIPYWLQKLSFKIDLNLLNSKERHTILDSDSLIEHDLGNQNMKDLIQAIEKVPEVEQAFLARKRVTARPNAPLYVLGVQGLKSHHFLRGIDPLDMLLEKLDMQFDTFVVPLNNNFKKLQRQFETMENALIYNRSGQENQMAGDR